MPKKKVYICIYIYILQKYSMFRIFMCEKNSTLHLFPAFNIGTLWFFQNIYGNHGRFTHQNGDFPELCKLPGSKYSGSNDSLKPSNNGQSPCLSSPQIKDLQCAGAPTSYRNGAPTTPIWVHITMTCYD